MVKDREASRAACSPWGGKESDMTEQLNNNILMARSKEELKNLLIRVKEEREKYVLKLNIKKTKIMASAHYCMANRRGKGGSSDRFRLLGL